MLKSHMVRTYEKLKAVYLTSQWKDTRLWTLVIFAVVVVVASWSGVRVIETNYELQKRIARLQQQNEVIRLQNNNQKLKNQYLETDTYLELSARRQFGKGTPGEKLLIVPENVALANAKDIPVVQPSVAINPATADTNTSGVTKNLRAWRDFIFSHKLDAPEE